MHLGVNISERKSETERTKKRKKLELVFFLPTTSGRNWYFGTSSGQYTDFATVTIIWDIFIPGPYAAQTKSQLNKKAKNTPFNNFAERIRFAEHRKQVAELSGFDFTLSRVHSAHFFQFQIRQKSGTF